MNKRLVLLQLIILAVMIGLVMMGAECECDDLQSCRELEPFLP